jgi:hypothetical protein
VSESRPGRAALNDPKPTEETARSGAIRPGRVCAYRWIVLDPARSAPTRRKLHSSLEGLATETEAGRSAPCGAVARLVETGQPLAVFEPRGLRYADHEGSGA